LTKRRHRVPNLATRPLGRESKILPSMFRRIRRRNNRHTRARKASSGSLTSRRSCFVRAADVRCGGLQSRNGSVLRPRGRSAADRCRSLSNRGRLPNWWRLATPLQRDADAPCFFVQLGQWEPFLEVCWNPHSATLDGKDGMASGQPISRSRAVQTPASRRTKVSAASRGR